MQLAKRILTISIIVGLTSTVLRLLKLVEIPSIIVTIALITGAVSFVYYAFKYSRDKHSEYQNDN